MTTEKENQKHRKEEIKMRNLGLKPKMIQGAKAEYSPQWYFVWNGLIYYKMKIQTGITKGHYHPPIDRVVGKWEEAFYERF